jgi:hypothetical protein
MGHDSEPQARLAHGAHGISKLLKNTPHKRLPANCAASKSVTMRQLAANISNSLFG